jgi:uncharacterized protein (DUF2235 family)
MPKNIVVCCDGTGNEFGDSNSNVVKLASTLIIDEQQVSYYHPGVGTMGAPNARTWLGKKWDVIRGLAFGYGVTFNIAEAYHYLMQTYRPGDHIYLFGFSRGAYTARALGGLLHMYGLLHKGNEGLIPYITEKFATRTKETQGMAHTLEVAEGFKQTFCQDVLIHFVGVWDTVSSVGWISDPVVIPFTANNPIMEIGRHAVSIDERRCFFRDNLWGKPFQPGEPGFRVQQDVKQVWFSGVHSDVGGSYPEGESGLSKITLEWMLREAKLAGLRIHDGEAKRVLGVAPPAPFLRPDPTDGQHESLRGPWWALEFLPHYKYDKSKGRPHWIWPPLGEHRHLPIDSLTNQNLAVLHESVFDRLKNVPKYRPPNLLGTNYPKEKYVPLFADAPGYAKTPDGQLASTQPDERRFHDSDPVGRVQAILDFKVDANPILQSAPDMWPKFPIIATVLTIAAVLLIQPAGKRRFWILGAIVAFWLLHLVFHKLYQVKLVTHYKQHRDELAKLVPSQPPKEPPPYVRGEWKALCYVSAGSFAAGMVLWLAYHTCSQLNYLWIVFAALVLLAAGLLPAMATLARARAYNAVLTAWAEKSDVPEFREYSLQLTKYRGVIEDTPTGGDHA